MEKLKIELRDYEHNEFALIKTPEGDVAILDYEGETVAVFQNELEVDLLSDNIKNLLKSK
tara:strand:+ start:323 stop:502 length:180 start_codon:yes stop_codon:yes gene_type:complete